MTVTQKLVSIGCGGLLIYVASYCLDSFLGGYWMKPEMDGRDRYSFGFAMPTAILWQPRVGHEALGTGDFIGAFYRLLIRVDRRFVHPPLYISDKDGFDRASNLPISSLHPHWREEYTKPQSTGKQ